MMLSQASIKRLAQQHGFTQVEKSAVIALQDYGLAHIKALLIHIRHHYPKAKRLRHFHINVGRGYAPHMNVGYKSGREQHIAPKRVSKTVKRRKAPIRPGSSKRAAGPVHIPELVYEDF